MANIKMISIAQTEDELRECFPVMHQLRPHLGENEFIERVQNQAQYSYKVAYLKDETQVVAVTGYRISHGLAWGKFLYVDDLVTDENQRSKGYGKQMLDWLTEQAKQQNCDQLHLDSGMQRKDAHRFYDRENMTRAGYHFSIEL